jgi:hypothetical protein
MHARTRTLLRRAGQLGLGVLGAELLYLAIIHLVLASGVIQRAASIKPEEAVLSWTRAWSPWPFHVYVEGLRLRVQDPILQFQLDVGAAEVDVAVWSLLHKEFRATRVRATGVGYRFLARVSPAGGRRAPVTAFPPIEGLAWPPLSPDPMPPLPTGEKLAAIWTVRLADVEAEVDELWFDEVRYLGPARISGGFHLAPLRELEVGPATLTLSGGALTVGERTLASQVVASAAIAIAPVDLQANPGLEFLDSVTVAASVDATLDDLGVADLYVDGLRLRGRGQLSVRVALAASQLGALTSATLSLRQLEARYGQYHFGGDVEASAAVAHDGGEPMGHLTMSGSATGDVADAGQVTAQLTGGSAELVLAGPSFAEAATLRRLSVSVGEVKVVDARPLTRRVALIVPVLAPMVLGRGPLIASGTAFVTPGYTLVRLKHGALGDAMLVGAAVNGANGWTGAMAGNFGLIKVGLKLRGGKLESVIFAPPQWLDTELVSAGIQPDER